MKENLIKGKTGRRRRFAGDRGGAAEIIGDLLLVAMSVTMVSALALQLSTVQNPSDTIRVDLEASYDGQNVTIMHLGGEQLHNDSTKFYLYIDGILVQKANITDGKAGRTWQMGERWTLNFPITITQRLRIQVIDTKDSVVILDQLLQRGPGSGQLPDLGLTPNDILVLFKGATFNDTNNPMAGDNVTLNITLHNFGPVPAYNFTVRLSDYSNLESRSYPILNTTLSINGSSTGNLTVNYTVPLGSWGMHTLTVRIVPLPNETRFSNNYASKEFRVGYTVIAFHPGNPVLRIRSIESYPRFPVHGAYVNLTSRISNQGGVPANATARYYLGAVSNATLIAQESGLGVPVGGETVSNVVWRTPRGGTQTVIVNVTDPTGTTDQQSIQVDVLPTILLVDDDRSATGGVRDVVSPMRDALTSVAASFTVHLVPAGADGPRYGSGEHPMKDYDLVIWMTGYENAFTLTANDQTELTDYLNSNGRLWLIGQDILSSLGPPNNFMRNMMFVRATTPMGFMNIGVTNPIIGMDILNLTMIEMNKPFTSGLTDRADAMLPTPGRSVPAFAEFGGGGRPLAILFNATTNGTPGIETYKAAFFGFEPTQVTSPNDRSVVTFEMLTWFGVSASWGRDLSVSDQRFSKITPAFMEDVNVTVYVRNNAVNNEPLDVSRPQLQVGFYVDGAIFDPKQVTIVAADGGITVFDPPTSEVWIPQDTTNASLNIPGKGGFIKVSLMWTADRIGQHTVAGRVDPYDYIDEINENNNEVSSELSKTIYVRYGTLVVDDDNSANNGGGSYNATANLTAALGELGYNYDLFEVPLGSDGPPLTKMELYNAIIWCAGEGANALTAADKANLGTFLDRGDGRYLWLIGARAVPNGDYSGGADPFVRDYLRVARVVNPPAAPRTPAFIEGANLDPVAHGVRYPTTPTFPDAGHILVPFMDGRGMLYQNPMPTTSQPNEVVYCDAQDGTVTGWYKRIIPAGTSSLVTNELDSSKGSRVIQLTRAGPNPSDSFFMIGDWSQGIDLNPNSLPWKEGSRFTATWSFRFSIAYTFVWHVTDTVGAHHTLTYTSSDSDNLVAEPVAHGLGSGTTDDRWHTVTRDLLLDLREGAGNGGLTIRQVDGFEVAMNVGSGRVDDLQLTRRFNTVRHDNVTSNYRTAFCAWDPSFISYDGNDEYNAELAYLVMSWFNMYDERAELRVTHLDLHHTNLTPLREMKPMMGESYMLKARVWNPGGARGDAVVRFSDGSTVIESVSVSVEHDSWILAEVIWTPLYAGNRTLSVAVDPDGVLGEIFKFNNLASLSIQVYFFYDDMEDGPNKWQHESTVLRLNGESTLEYMDPGPVSTSIIGSWAEMSGWRNTTDNASLPNITSQYHSQGAAFYMHEPISQTRTPVDVILTSDATGSMTTEVPNSRIEGVKSAMFQFVNRLQPSDRGAIASFTTLRALNSFPNPPLVPFYTELHTALTNDKQRMCDGIANITVASMTPFWNAVVTSYTYIKDYGDSSRVRCMVILTDGDSNADRPDVNTARATAFATVKTAPVPIFVIGYGMGIRGTIVETRMINLAAEANQTGGGGGWYYFAPNANEVGYVFANISKAIEELAQTMGRGGAAFGPEASLDASGRTVLFSDNMELGAGSWVLRDQSGAGSRWRRVQNDFRNTGVWAWRCYNGAGNYVNGDDDWLVTPLIDAQGYRDLKLGFWHRPGLYRRDGSGCDFGYVFLSNDNGATWTGVQAFTNNLYNNVNANGATVTGVDLSVLPATSQMRVAFRMWSDPWNFATGWSIDDVTVTGTLGWGRSEGPSAEGRATVTILQEGFEIEPPPGWTITNTAPLDSYWHRDPSWAHTDSYSYRCFRDAGNQYRKLDDDTLDSPTFDLSGGYTTPLLTFWHRTDVKAGDWCYAYVSNDNGASWTMVWQSDTENNSWAAVMGLDLTVSGSVPLTNQMKISFRFVANNDNNVDTGWSVDDILITAVTPPAPPPPESFTAYWNDGFETPTDKWITTKTFSLAGVSSATLTFWHKYDLKVGSNGGVLMVGTCSTSADGPFKYHYVSPTQPYPNNLKIGEWGSAHLKDDYGADMRWCWNGISGAGKFSWDYIKADLTPYVGSQYVRIKFLYLFCGGGTGFGWAIDDVEVKVRRSDSVAVTSTASDQWELVEEGQTYGDDYADGRFAASGRYSWWNHNPQGGIDTLKGGLDNSLTSIPIDLSRAKDAYLLAKLRFNVFYPEGRPPDGFRVEVSSDNGISWRQINMGVRSAWNVSGTEAAGPDGTSYTGVNLGDNWVSSTTLTRVNCDLSGWSGSVIQLRFRVVTRNDTPQHYENLGAGFGGFFIDDVMVIGNTTTGQGRGAEGPGAGGQGPGTDTNPDVPNARPPEVPSVVPRAPGQRTSVPLSHGPLPLNGLRPFPGPEPRAPQLSTERLLRPIDCCVPTE